MRSILKLTAGVVLAGGLALAPALAASAASWEHGVRDGRVFSNYWHGSAKHGSTSVGKTTVRSRTLDPGLWSITSVAAKVSGNQAYWRTE